MAEWLDGKKTVIAGFVVAVFGFIQALGVSLPISAPTADVIVGVLGIVVVIARMFAKKPGVLASPSSKS